MSQSNKGLVAVLGGGCMLGLLLALGYVFYWSPRQIAEDARAEIRSWGESWQEARTCLLGESLHSSDPTEALIARELVEAHVKSSLSRCLPKLKPLGREEGGTTGDIDIEKAWFALRGPVSKLAQAHAWRTATTPNKDGQTLRSNLGAAIKATDAGYASLRSAAKMKSAATQGQPLMATSVYMALHGPDESANFVTDLRLRSEAVTYTVENETSRFRAKVPGATDVAHFQALSPLALRAVDSEWGLWLEEDGIPVIDRSAQEGARLIAGPLDAQGEPAGDGALLHTLAKGESLSLSFATGGDKRTALYRLEQPGQDAWTRTWAYRLLSSEDAGITWTTRSLPDGEIWVWLREATDNSYILWTDASDPMTLELMTISKAGIQERRVKFPGERSEESTWPPDMCLAPNRLWWVMNGALYSMGTGARLVAIPGTIEYDTNLYAYQLLCGDDHAAVHSQAYAPEDSALRYQACSLERCDKIVKSKSRAEDANVHHVFHQGAWHTIQELDGIVAVWRGGDTKEPQSLLRLGIDGDLKGIVSWRDAILFLVWPEDAASPVLLRAQ